MQSGWLVSSAGFGLLLKRWTTVNGKIWSISGHRPLHFLLVRKVSSPCRPSTFGRLRTSICPQPTRASLASISHSTPPSTYSRQNSCSQSRPRLLDLFKQSVEGLDSTTLKLIQIEIFVLESHWMQRCLQHYCLDTRKYPRFISGFRNFTHSFIHQLIKSWPSFKTKISRNCHLSNLNKPGDLLWFSRSNLSCQLI